jgi:hypothetical protein
VVEAHVLSPFDFGMAGGAVFAELEFMGLVFAVAAVAVCCR